MSAANKKKGSSKSTSASANEVELMGKVVIKKMAAGSKSEHDAVFLETGEQSYVLRKIGANPFFDPSLHKLEGKTVNVKGLVNDKLILAKEVTEQTGKDK